MATEISDLNLRMTNQWGPEESKLRVAVLSSFLPIKVKNKIKETVIKRKK